MDRLVVSLDFLEFPSTYTCDGENLSPRLSLKGLNASSVAVMLFNPFKKILLFIHPVDHLEYPPGSEDPSRNSARRQGHFTHTGCPVYHRQRDNRLYGSMSPAWPDDTVSVQGIWAGRDAWSHCRVQQTWAYSGDERACNPIWWNSCNMFTIIEVYRFYGLPVYQLLLSHPRISQYWR